MSAERVEAANWKLYAIISLAVMVAITVIAALTGLWVLTAVPVGFLFGFFLQKGDLCGSSAFSEVLLMKDWQKIWGLWVCIVTGMVGFAALDLLGWIALNPKPMIWANYVIGGLLFGIGMVLAGGCVSGCLFKSGAGNLNSMVALLGIALGVSLVEYGPLSTINASLKQYVLKAAEGKPVTLSSMTGFSFGAIALFFAVVTIVASFVLARMKTVKQTVTKKPFSLKEKVLARTWRPWQAGLLIGILGSAAYLSSASSGRNYPLGVTHGVMHAQLLITDRNLVHVYMKTPPPEAAQAKAPEKPESPLGQQPAPTPTPGGKKVSWWLILLVSSLVTGSWVSGRLSGETRLLPKPPEQVFIAFFGGLLVGTGAAIAGGCVIGNITSGWALMSTGTVLFGVVVILANWATTYIYLMGGGKAA